MSQIVKFRPFPSTNFNANGLLDEFFNRGLTNLIGSDTLASQPAVNIIENKDGFRLEFAAPGFDKSNFNVTLDGQFVVVEGKREAAAENNDERFTRREFRFESFKRSYKLPDFVNKEAIAAVYENGILTVTLPKKEEVKAVAKTIEVA